jgi:hypothetical protein
MPSKTLYHRNLTKDVPDGFKRACLGKISLDIFSTGKKMFRTILLKATVTKVVKQLKVSKT